MCSVIIWRDCRKLAAVEKVVVVVVLATREDTIAAVAAVQWLLLHLFLFPPNLLVVSIPLSVVVSRVAISIGPVVLLIVASVVLATTSRSIITILGATFRADDFSAFCQGPTISGTGNGHLLTTGDKLTLIADTTGVRRSTVEAGDQVVGQAQGGAVHRRRQANVVLGVVDKRVLRLRSGGQEKST